MQTSTPEKTTQRSEAATRIGAMELAISLDGDSVQRIPLSEVLGLPFEQARPIRRFGFYRGQRSNAGWYWSSTTGTHVPYESRLELAHLLEADFDPDVVGIAAQPFGLHWRESGRARRHTPDFLLIRSSAVPRLVNVTTPRRREKPTTARGLHACATAARRLGWASAVKEFPDPVRLRNLRLLSAARREDWSARRYSDALIAAAEQPLPILALERAVGPSCLVRPAVLHLLWWHRLAADLSRPLSGSTSVRRAER